MELGILIFKQIISMFIMILVGFILIRLKIIKNNAGLYLAKIVIYVVLPCTIVNAFQIERNPNVINGMIFAFVIALICNIFLVVFSKLLSIILKLNTIEQATIAYPNSGEMLIPLVTSVLSPDMVIYSCAFMIVQILFMFTHGMSLLSENNNNDKLSIIKNQNVIAIIIGICLFIFNIKIPSIISSTMNSFSGMIAPMSMLIIGCSMANCNLKDKINNKRIYGIILLRQIIVPIIYLLVIKLLNLKTFMVGAEGILLIIYMAMASSPATTIVNIVQSYNKDVEYASIINVIGVSLLIITLPVMIFIYLMFV